MNLGKLYSAGIISVLLCLLVISGSQSIAQIPTNQDCLGAIPVCTGIYDQLLSYTGDGNYNDEIGAQQGCPENCMDHEKNSVWYVISVQSNGLLRFIITPKNVYDDYDWAVYNLSDHECSEILGGSLIMQSSCNAAGNAAGQTNGPTGISSLQGGNQNCINGGSPSRFNKDLPVLAGETYVLCVSNWSSTQNGYLLDFTSSTAGIFDDVPAYVTAIDTVRGCAGSASVSFDFNENILCASVQYSDFTVIGPDGIHLPNSVFGAGCDAMGNQEKFYTLSDFYPPITQTGIYTLTMVGEVEDLCYNTAIAPPIDFYADIDPLPALTLQPVNLIIPVGNTGSFHIEATGADTYRWQIKDGLWVNLTETLPYSGTNTNTLTINNAPFELGGSQYRCVVSGPCTPSAQSESATLYVGDALAASASADPEEICLRESTQLNVEAFGGSLNYSYSWSNSSGWTSDLPNPVVEPYVTTTYTVVVNDGYSPEITLNVTVQVNPLPIAVAGPDQDIPHGTQTQLSCSNPATPGPYTFHWEPVDSLWNSNVQNPNTIKLRGSCNFTVFIVDGNGCIGDPDITTVNVIGGPLNASPVAQPNEICFGDTAILSALASGGDTQHYNYSWSINGGNEISTSPTLSVVPNETTTYTLFFTDGSNELTRTVTVIVNPLPEISLIKSNFHVINGIVQVCAFDSLVIDAGYQNGEYLWDNGGTTFTNTIATSGIAFDYQIHSVRVTEPITGCINQDSIEIAFTFSECTYGVNEIDFKNIIKIYPNPAGNSVTLTIDGKKSNFILEITDLYGRSVFRDKFSKTSSGILNHEIKSTSLANGTYLIKVASIDGSIVKKLVIHH